MKANKSNYWLYLLTAAAIIAVAVIVAYLNIKSSSETPLAPEYNPQIVPADFTSPVNNPYFTLTPGKKIVYESQTADGMERIETYVTHEKRRVIGVVTIVVWDRVWLEGDLIEETKDWYAQDMEGNVWYFGEDSKELVDGKIISSKGSWEAGVDGAQPGIIMRAVPRQGESYRQEYYEGEAEDMADVLEVNESVAIKYGLFSGCIKTFDYTPLDPDLKEYKYYCPEAGGVVLEVNANTAERMELISVVENAEPSPAAAEPEILSAGITEAEAIEIAVGRVAGTVKDVAIEKKYGKTAYAVEIDAANGPETDVIIDAYTGEVLGIEI